MPELTDEELLAALDIKVESKPQPSLTSLEDHVIAGFKEIQNFYNEYNRVPINEEGRDIFERLFSVRLQRIRQLNDYLSLLEPLDHQGLLTKSVISQDSDLNEKVDDQTLITKLGIDKVLDGINQLRHVRSSEERRIAEEIAKRESCSNFAKFKPIFEKVKSELDQGIRETVRLSKRPEINVGDFFILGGQKTYIANVGKTFMQEYGTSDARLYIIFDNGTESRMLMRSLQRALSMDDGARQITNTTLGPLFASQPEKGDKESGTIYVLRSMSNHPAIVENRELYHKIGVTTSTIKKRISNAKDDPTFLMAEVEVVASYKLFNIKPKKLEHLIQKIFGLAKLDIQIPDRFGKPYSPQEWFMVPLQSIETAVERIKDGTITRYRFDPLTARLIERSDSSK
ncbi:GIY-YIG nuclease family protein [Prochlorococcus marinus]|uniref:GIY-YIG nuclease family protein n=1 Tax=Prochlorococcus marinus TaxID=1219 RepID=UPI0022B4A65C|nr:GIY-YIG nuclease family protein [Prochlorococcus marinus]